MSKIVKIINTAVFSIWIALLLLLMYKSYRGDVLESNEIVKEYFSKKNYWYDIYKGAEKIGFAMTSYERAGDEILIKHRSEMKAIKKETLLIEELRCLTDLYYSVKSIEYTSNFKGQKGIRLSGDVDDDTIVFFLESSEKRKTHKLSIDGKDFYLPLTLIPVLHQKMHVPNSPFVVPMLNFATLTIDDVKAVLEEIRPIKVGTNILNLYKYRVGDSVFWINEMGNLIKEEHLTGTTLYSQFEDIAKESDKRILFDYTSLPFFKSNDSLTNIEDLNLIKVKIRGYNLAPELYKNSPITLKDNILIIRRQDKEELKKQSFTLPYKEESFNKYLSPDRWIISDYEPLAKTGRIYAKTYDYDAFRLVNYLKGYIYNLIKAMPTFALQNSRDIHKSLSGDYLERSVLLATYTRAAGLPTRLVGGLVYVKGYFYFHTWPEIWLDRWVPVDPTLYQFPADITHIPLKEGTLGEIVSMIDELKNVRIDILEAS